MSNPLGEHKTQRYIDFVVGRGHHPIRGGLNIPINPEFARGNIMYIDSLEEAKPDIQAYLGDVDFKELGITHEDDPTDDIRIRFFFDWSSFFCGAVGSVHTVSSKLRPNRPSTSQIQIQHH